MLKKKSFKSFEHPSKSDDNLMDEFFLKTGNISLNKNASINKTT